MFPIISDQHHHTMHDCVVYNFKRSISLMPQSGSKSKHLKDHLAPRVSNVLPALFCVRYVQGDFLTAPSLSLKSLSMEKLGKVNLRWQIDERFTIPGKNLQLHWNKAGSQEIRPDSNHPTKPINLMHALLLLLSCRAPDLMQIISYLCAADMWLINSAPVFRHLAPGINKMCT